MRHPFSIIKWGLGMVKDIQAPLVNRTDVVRLAVVIPRDDLHILRVDF